MDSADTHNSIQIYCQNNVTIHWYSVDRNIMKFDLNLLKNFHDVFREDFITAIRHLNKYN